MKRFVWILNILFVILTFAGAGYVVFNKGQVSAGYAVIPMVLSIVCLTFYRSIKGK